LFDIHNKVSEKKKKIAKTASIILEPVKRIGFWEASCETNYLGRCGLGKPKNLLYFYLVVSTRNNL